MRETQDRQKITPLSREDRSGTTPSKRAPKNLFSRPGRSGGGGSGKAPPHSNLMKYLSYGLLFVVVITFVGVPLASGFLGNSSTDNFGYYRGLPIKYRTYNYFGRGVAQLSQSLGANGGNIEYFKSLIWRNVFENYSLLLALYDTALRSGFEISEQRYGRLVRENYVDERGEFDEQRYLKASSIEKNSLKESLEQSVLAQELLELYQGSWDDSSAWLIEPLLELETHQRSVQFTYLSYNDLPYEEVLPLINDERTFYSVEWEVLSSDNLQQVQKWKESLENTENTIDSLLLEDPQAKNDVLSGSFFFYQLVEREFFDNNSDLEALFTLEEGQFSEPIQTSLGTALFHIQKVTLDPDFQSADLQSEVRSYTNRFSQDKLKDQLMLLSEDWKEQLTGGGFKQEFLHTFDKDLKESEPLALNYGNQDFLTTFPDGSLSDENFRFSSLAHDEDFLKALFSLETPCFVGSFAQGEVYVFVWLSQILALEDIPQFTFSSKINSSIEQLQLENIKNLLLVKPYYKDNFDGAYQAYFSENT